MAKFLFTGWPYPGCLNPQMAVAHALRTRGHTVGFYNGTKAHSLIIQEGFVHFPFGQILDQQIERLLSQPDGIGSSWRNPWHARRLVRAFFLETVPHQIADLDAVMETWKPEVIICERPMWGPYLILHESHQVSVALLDSAICLQPGSAISPPGLGLPLPRTWLTRLGARLGQAIVDLMATDIRRSASRLRKHYGLPALDRSMLAMPGQLPLLLVPNGAEFDYQRQDLPTSVHYVGPCLWYPSAQESLDWLAELPRDRPWVHVTEGTLYAQTPVILHAAARGLANLYMQVIMTTGTQRVSDTMHLGPLAPNVYVKSWIPHADLMPNVDVLVTHGGGGTVVAALTAGVPMVIVPLMWDQGDNAQRVVDAGVGLRLSPRQCTPTALRRAVKHVLREPSYRQNAQRLATCLRRYGGPTQAATLLEGLALESRCQ